ncbi:MAG TPA: sulfite exporter TauE/SafE family protein [Trebonia sp.]|nr:sulfite exporter TauE/SafE family protein [Trebonia sp.]
MPHDLLRALAIFAVGLAAGTINTVVGSGTLITFPTLLAFGYPPVLANVSNNVGLVPGVASGVYGYRSELGGQRRRLIRLGSASVCGGLVGAILLLTLPQSAFKDIVPGLIGLAVVMVIVQPRLAKWVAGRQRARAATATPGGAGADTDGASGSGDGGAAVAVAAPPAAAEAIGGPVLWVLVFLAGIYGGYFGAAQGVLLIGMLGIALNDSLQRVNAAKNVLAGLVNGLAAVVFILATHVDWGVAGLIAAGSIIGGQVGARIGKRLPPWALRVVIVCVGTAALIKLLA